MRTKPVYRVVTLEGLAQSSTTQIEHLLCELFVTYHRHNKVEPSPEGIYIVSMDIDHIERTGTIMLMQAEHDLTLIFPHLRRLPQRYVREWSTIKTVTNW